jgi:hypothetical protein
MAMAPVLDPTAQYHFGLNFMAQGIHILAAAATVRHCVLFALS